MKIFKITFGIAVLSMLMLYSCKFKQKAEVQIKGEGGSAVLEVEVVAGAEFKTKGVIPANWCQGSQAGTLITVASCDVLTNVTRKVKKSDGTFGEETRQETHTLEYKIACIPGTAWEVDCSDPIILQVPTDWQIAEATFSKTGFQGNLVIDETLPTSDYYGTPYLAEPGYKLITVGFPYGTIEDTYQISLRCTYANLGHSQIKAIFAAAVRTVDPNTGAVRQFYPPAIPAVNNFALVNDPLFTVEVTGAAVIARQIDDQEAAALSLPQAGERTYVALSAYGADPTSVDLNNFTLKTD